MTLPSDSVALATDRIYDGAVWHRPAYAVTMFGEVGHGKCRFLCGRHEIVRAVAEADDPQVDYLCADCEAVGR